MPFFIVRQRSTPQQIVTAIADNQPFESPEAATAAAAALYPGIEFTIVEAENPEDAVLRAIGRPKP